MTRRQSIKSRQALARGLLMQAASCDSVAFGALLKQHQPLISTPVVELHLDVEPAPSRCIEPVEQIGAHQHALEALHLRQQFVDVADFPTVLGALSVLQETVGLVDEQQGVALVGPADVPVEQVGGTRAKGRRY